MAASPSHLIIGLQLNVEIAPMKLRRRYALIVACLALSAMFWFRSPISAEELGIDFWNIHTLENDMARSEDRSREMDFACQSTLTRIKSREQVIINLINHEISFDEAARAFLNYNMMQKSALEYLRGRYPHGTDLDRAYLQVIMHVSTIEDPQAMSTVELLNCELVATRSYMLK